MKVLGKMEDGSSLVMLTVNEIAFLELAEGLATEDIEDGPRRAKKVRVGRPKGSQNKIKRGSRNNGKVPKYLRSRKVLRYGDTPYTRKEAAAYLGISISKINGQIYRGWTDDAIFGETAK